MRFLQYLSIYKSVILDLLFSADEAWVYFSVFVRNY